MVVDQTIETLTEILKGYTQSPFKKDITILEVVLHTTYIDKKKTSISNYMWEIKKNLGTDSILKWEIAKNTVSRKWEIKIAIYGWRRNLI